MYLTDLLAIIGCVIMIVKNLYIFMIGRLIVGIVAGIHSALVPLYIKVYNSFSIF
jgi:hypothetical protein